MPRPRNNPDETAAYIHAADVFTKQLGTLFLRCINRSLASGRMYTFNEGRMAPRSVKVFGPELCDAAAQVLAGSPHPPPWRVYFPKDWDAPTDYGAIYDKAKDLHAEGFPHQVIACALGVSPTSLWRNVPEVMKPPAELATTDPELASAGWDFLISKGHTQQAEDPEFCALVGQAIAVVQE